MSVVSGLAPGWTSAAGPSDGDPRTQTLQDALVRPIPSEGIRISVVLREPDAATPRTQRRDRIGVRQAAVLARMNRGRFTLGRRYRWLSGFSGWADAEAIEALMSDADVVLIDVDRIAYATLTQGAALVGATSVQSLGVTGNGVTVALLDTGIDTDHPDLSSSLVAEACFCDDAFGPFGCCPNGRDTQSGAGSAEDDEGHGSATAGVIVSSRTSNKGVAPEASIVALKVLGSSGSGNFSDVADALDWVIDNRLSYGIKIVSLSLGDGLEYNSAAGSPCTGSNTADAMAQLKSQGVSVFVSSGNGGFDNGISFPACVPDAFSVGGVYDASFGEVSWCGETCSEILCVDQSAGTDTFVCHTNSGSLLDILAPDYRTTVPALGGGTVNVGGTSIASPYAAAQAALLLDLDATLTPDQILSWLETSAPMVTNPDNGMSFPRARVDLAVALLLAVCGNAVVEAGEDCDDGNTTSGDCCDGGCQFEAPGSSCDDSDLCTLTDGCDGAGGCVGTGSLTCDDSDVCTDDSCIPASGCQFTANTAACDDLDACTSGDICSGGMCMSGMPVACDDSNLCTNDSCNPASGCQFTANTAPCDDTNSCTDGDVCFGGSCTPGSALDCDDQDECTADGCDELTGCFHEPIQGCSLPPTVPSSTPTGLAVVVACFVVGTLWTLGGRRRASPHC